MEEEGRMKKRGRVESLSSLNYLLEILALVLACDLKIRGHGDLGKDFCWCEMI